MKFPTKSRAKSRIAAGCIAFMMTVGSLVGPTNVARAEADTPNDARLDCFAATAGVAKDSGTAVIWLLFVFMTMAGLGGLFLDAKRGNMK